MKFIMVALTLVILSARPARAGNFNPHPHTPIPDDQPSAYLSCKGHSFEFPEASISYDSRKNVFTVSVSSDLDVPGGAFGSHSLLAVGSITPTEINLTFKGLGGGEGGKVSGIWKGSSYLTTIGENTFDCVLPFSR